MAKLDKTHARLARSHRSRYLSCSWTAYLSGNPAVTAGESSEIFGTFLYVIYIGESSFRSVSWWMFFNVSLGGGFKYFLFSPRKLGNDPIWRAYFSKGLVQPPILFPNNNALHKCMKLWFRGLADWKNTNSDIFSTGFFVVFIEFTMAMGIWLLMVQKSGEKTTWDA